MYIECAHEQHVRRTLTPTHTITAYSVSGNSVRVRILICATIHKSRVEKEFTQIMYSLRVLRAQGLDNAALQHVCRTIAIARMTFAVSAWHGFTTASDRQCINQAQRNGYCPPDLPTFEELCTLADVQLFSKTVRLSKFKPRSACSTPTSICGFTAIGSQAPHTLTPAS